MSFEIMKQIIEFLLLSLSLAVDTIKIKRAISV